MTELTAWSLNSLTNQCQTETDRYWKQQTHDDRYCHELFRRALAAPNEVQSKQAWAFVHAAYFRQVLIWVKRHQAFTAVGTDPDPLAVLALEKMWLAFSNAPDKWTQFPKEAKPCLQALLAYLKVCVHSVIMDTLSEKPTISLDGLEQAEYVDLAESVAAAEFWQCVYRRLRSAQERLVVDASFVYGLKPRHIYEMYPDEFASVKEVSRIKDNVRKRLSRDTNLHDCFDLLGISLSKVAEKRPSPGLYRQEEAQS